MTRMMCAVREEIEMPEGAVVEHAPTGVISGIRLKDGRLIRTFIAYEIEEENGDHRDLETQELDKIGLYTTLDLERMIEPVS